MMKIMLVEDDVMFRHAVRTILDWEAFDFKIVAEAINGRHALQLINSCEPDILLSDISMPEMNGIDLIIEVKKTFPHIKIIVLSNYDEFNFVKEALKYGAEDYLLKMELEPKALLKVMEQLKIKVEDERRQEMENRFLRSNFSTIADSFLKKLLSGEIQNLEEIRNNTGILKLKINLSNLIVMLLEIEGTEKYRDESALSGTADVYIDNLKKVRGIIETVTEDYHNGAVADLENGTFAVVLSFFNEKSEAKLKSGIHEIACRIRELVQLYSGYTVTIGISKPCYTVTNVSIYHTQAKMALEGKIYEGTGKIYFYDVISSLRHEERSATADFPEKLLNAVKSCGPQEVRDVVEDFFSELYSRRLQGFELKKELFELYTVIFFAAREQNMDFMKLDGTNLFPIDVIEHMDTLEQKKYYLLELFLNLNKSFNAKKTVYKKEVQKILDFIHANYMKDITLSEIANELKFSPNYLCNLFKQETGNRLVEFINKVRIEEAKILLKKNNLKVYEVAVQVGFNNTSYFCTVFKDITGITVSEYKNNEEKY